MTVAGAIVAFGPLFVTVFGFFLVGVAGLVWSPIAVLIVRGLTRDRTFYGPRYGWESAACSVFLLLPWILLVVALVRGRLPCSALCFAYILLHLVWLIGPIVFWGQYILGMDIFWLGEGPDEIFAPGGWLVGYSVFAAMILAWSGSVFSLSGWHFGNRDVTLEELIRFRVIMPFVVAWGSNLLAYGSLYTFSL